MLHRLIGTALCGSLVAGGYAFCNALEKMLARQEIKRLGLVPRVTDGALTVEFYQGGRLFAVVSSDPTKRVDSVHLPVAGPCLNGRLGAPWASRSATMHIINAAS